MYKCINGWTKNKMLKVIKARRYNCAAHRMNHCEYLTANGNKCAVGLFLKPGSEAQRVSGGYEHLIEQFPEVIPLMPLNKRGMNALQEVHDNEAPSMKMNYKGNAKRAMIDWVNKNVI